VHTTCSTATPSSGIPLVALRAGCGAAGVRPRVSPHRSCCRAVWARCSSASSPAGLQTDQHRGLAARQGWGEGESITSPRGNAGAFAEQRWGHLVHASVCRKLASPSFESLQQFTWASLKFASRATLVSTPRLYDGAGSLRHNIGSRRAGGRWLFQCDGRPCQRTCRWLRALAQAGHTGWAIAKEAIRLSDRRDSGPGRGPRWAKFVAFMLCALGRHGKVSVTLSGKARGLWD